MQTRIERRRARVGRWLLYPLIALTATALAGLAIASPPAKSTAYRVIPPSPSAFSGVINARGQVAFTDSTGTAFGCASGIRAGQQGRGRRLR